MVTMEAHGSKDQLEALEFKNISSMVTVTVTTFF